MSIKPPRYTAPSLNALRAFEAAARHGSIVAAADELAVTPGAVAQQIKALEAWVGERLFHRKPRGIMLTPLGRSALADFTSAFDQLGIAVQKLRGQAGSSEVRIATLPAIAQLWLSPKLPRIRALMPDTTISVTALETPPNLMREPFDLSIFLIPHPLPANSIEICRDVIFPVCSPQLAQGLRDPKDLTGMTFLHDAVWSSDWVDWLADTAPGMQFDTNGPKFSLYSLAVEEARNDAGVLIGHAFLVERDLQQSKLVAPFIGQKLLERSLVIQIAETLPVTALARQVAHHLAENSKSEPGC